MNTINNYIGGELVPAKSGATLANIEPATGLCYGTLPDSDANDVVRATVAAWVAQPLWSGLPARERAHWLRKIASAIQARLPEFAQAESTDTGKPLRVAREVDIPRAAYNFEFFADAATQFASESHATDARTLNYTLRSPLGVVGCISPWNLPLYLLSWKIAPALAAGNTVVAKPSEVTPMTAHLLARVCIDIGLPPGVLNIVHGVGARVGAPLVQSSMTNAISFTGSTATGASIAESVARSFKKLSLEMGGKNASIVFDDCDFDFTVAEVARAAFSNQGQICLCGSRILVARKLYTRFRDALAAHMQTFRVGDPNDENTTHGALVSQEHMQKVLRHLEIAREEGAITVQGGARVNIPGRCQNGYFVEPTLLEGLRPAEGLNEKCVTLEEEIFGPVATLQPFDSDDEALSIANSTRYGLATSIFTRDISRAHNLAARVQTGLVWINCWMERDLRVPFGGMKESGLGREGGWEAMRFFTEPKNVCIRY